VFQYMTPERRACKRSKVAKETNKGGNCCAPQEVVAVLPHAAGLRYAVRTAPRQLE